MDKEGLTVRLQKKELQMLEELSEILDRNHIPFFLAYGTALGCIRHKGFIPWDDDVDIFVKGNDYPRIKEIFKTQNTGNLQLHDYDTVRNYPYCFPKIVAGDTLLIEKALTHIDYQGGVYIDIFPLAEVSDNIIVRTVKSIYRYICYSIIRAYYYNYKSTFRKIFSQIVRKWINPVKIQKKIFAEYIRSEKDCKFYLGSIDAGELYKKQYFDSVVYMPFEESRMPMAVDYDNILTEYYGDYMKLPDEENRVSNHNFSVLEFNV